MQAAVIVSAPQGGQVVIRDLPIPEPATGEILVNVCAAAINRGEVMARRAYTSGAPRQNGIEFAGEVVSLGEAVTDWSIGNRVMGHWQAGQAEYVTVDQRLAIAVPDHLSWIEAAAWPNVFITAHNAIVTTARLQAGESILINAASSGIGVAALQIARLLGATPVLGTSRSADKLDKLRAYGLEVGITGTGQGFTNDVLGATNGAGVNVVIDNIGPDVLTETMYGMALQGRLVSVGRLGSQQGNIDMDLLARKRLSLLGVTFRTRSLMERIACVQQCAADLLPALQDGQLQPVVDRVFPLPDIAAAHAYMEENSHIGKIVLNIAR